MPLVLAPRGDDNKFSQDSFVFDMIPFGFSVLKKGKNGYEYHGAEPDFIVSHNPHDADDAVFLRKHMCKPSVVHIHYQTGYIEDERNLSLSLSSASAAIVPSRFLADQITRKFPNVECHVVSNGIRRHLFFPSIEAERSQFRQSHNIRPDTTLIGFVGRLTKAKGLQILEALCRELGDSHVSLFLQFPFWHNAADPAERDRSLTVAESLRQLAPGNVTIYPDPAPRLGPRPTRFFDALLMPSLSEVQPMVVLEALASGVPVIGTRSTPFYEELDASNVGERACRFIDLPARFRDGDTNDDHLEVDELRLLVAALFDALSTSSPLSDAQRRALSDSLPLKYIDTHMYRQWTRLYQRYELAEQ